MCVFLASGHVGWCKIAHAIHNEFDPNILTFRGVVLQIAQQLIPIQEVIFVKTQNGRPKN